MNDELLMTLANKFGTTVEHLWNVLIYQSVIGGVTQLIVIIVIGFVFHYSYFKMKKALPHDDHLNDDEMVIFLRILFFVAIGIYVGISITFLTDIPGRLLNPEYWALMQLKP